MSSVRFYLKDQHSKGYTSIYMVLCYGAQRGDGLNKKYAPFKYYVGERILPVHWSKKYGRAKTFTNVEYHMELNRRLNHIEYTAQAVLLRLKNEGKEITREILHASLDRLLEKGDFKRKGTPSFLRFIREYIEEIRMTKSVGTIKQYENTLRLLRQFSKEMGAGALSFESIDMSFYVQLKSYMSKLGLSEAYFGTQIKCIKLFMNEATERGYNTQQQYRSKKFVSPSGESQKIYLTEVELEQLRRLNLNAQPSLRKIRDMFYIACKTGLRFSDLRRIAAKNFLLDGKILCIQTQKTGTVVHVPLSTEVQLLCKQYNHALPGVSSQHFNKCLKKIAQLANISGEVELRCSDKTNIRKKHELVCTHTARRSFATNAYLAGIPSIAIMRITGHATEKAFMRYIRIEGEDNAQQLLQHPYFE